MWDCFQSKDVPGSPLMPDISEVNLLQQEGRRVQGYADSHNTKHFYNALKTVY